MRKQYEIYRRRRRRDPFTMAENFVQAAGPLTAAPRRVTVRSADFLSAYDEYHQRFQEALKEGAPSLARE